MNQDWTGWTLIFDLDGTLVESAPDLHAALNHVLADKGLNPIPLSTIRMMIGDGAKAMIRKGLDWNGHPINEAEIDAQLWPAFIDHYLANITRLSHLYEGVAETLSALKEQGATLAVCTNKAQHLSEAVLEGLNIAHLFTATLGADKATQKKPNGVHILETLALAGGLQERAIMVGDSIADEKAAQNAGLPFVFVTFGYGRLSGDPFQNLISINHWADMETALTQLANPTTSDQT